MQIYPQSRINKISHNRILFLHLKLTLRGHTDYIHDISLKTDGNILASASEDGLVNLWGMCVLVLLVFSNMKGFNEETVPGIPNKHIPF